MVYLETIKRSIIFIEDHIERKLSIHEVARHVAYSPYHFSRIFLRHTGISLGNYIKLRRLSLASTKLLEPDTKAIDVSSLIGYTSYEAFSREFKTIFGESPFYFRNSPFLSYLKTISLIDTQLLEHLTNKLDFIPTETMISSFQLLGETVTTELKNNQLPLLWELFNNKMKRQLIKPINDIDSFAICKSANSILEADGNSLFSNFIGYHKTDCLSNDANELEQVVVNAGKYVVFKHNDTYHSLELSYRYIWHIWVHSSSFTYDDSRESFEQHITNGELILIYIPIR